MDDILGRILAILLAIILTFVPAILSITDDYDEVSQDVLTTNTYEFVNNVRNSGFVSIEQYKKYVSQISTMENIYKIEMVCEHKKYVPRYNDAGTFLNGYEEVTECFYQKDILKEMNADPDGRYYMSAGDFFYVKVRNKTVSLGAKFKNLFTGTNLREGTISEYYGGVVRNEVN